MSNLLVNVGVQPIDALMLQLGLRNSDLVHLASDLGLTHKQVAKARRGRRLSLRIQNKIITALNRIPNLGAPIRHEDCFTYLGKASNPRLQEPKEKERGSA
ncbi:MAG: hypothetical protein NZ740_08095 [Kiritimatiellae bacterium]|nr:hypothetical protein [Kiritimatiellia bacterium]MDW8459054.1 hypothetical protein [Verrucomicrobiota bacterium]